MVMLNDLDRFHLVMDVIDRIPGLATRAAHLRQQMANAAVRPRLHPRHGEDEPEIRDWTWPYCNPDVLVVNAARPASS